jgi:hypothetical protein
MQVNFGRKEGENTTQIQGNTLPTNHRQALLLFVTVIEKSTSAWNTIVAFYP